MSANLHDGKAAIVDAMFTDWSPRTRKSYVRAWRLAEFAGLDIVNLIGRAGRGNGTFSVARVLELAESAAAMKLVRQQQERA